MSLSTVYRASTTCSAPHTSSSTPQSISALLISSTLYAEASQKPSLASEAQNLRMDQIVQPARAGGYYQVSKPNFAVSLPCESCSRIIKLYPTDWGDYCTTVQPEILILPVERTSSTGPLQIPEDTKAITKALELSGLITLTHGQTIVYSTTKPPIITLNDRVFTANEAGFYSLGPDCTLIPGGQPATIDGTALKLECGRTKIVIDGGTSELKPITIAVTSTVESSEAWKGGYGYTAYSASGGSMPRLPLSLISPTTQATSAGNALRPIYGKVGSWTGALVLVLVVIGL